MSEKAQSLALWGTIVLATHNPGKLRELAMLFDGYEHLRTISVAEFSLSAPAEIETTFAANAMIKARYGASQTGLPALADDSGLEVAALEGAPGVLSARWGGVSGDFDLAMSRVREELAARAIILPAMVSDEPVVAARFICALALSYPDGTAICGSGALDGSLIWPPRGKGGFGYDPIFVARGYQASLAELDHAEKHAISHRQMAFSRLRTALLSAGALPPEPVL